MRSAGNDCKYKIILKNKKQKQKEGDEEKVKVLIKGGNENIHPWKGEKNCEKILFFCGKKIKELQKSKAFGDHDTAFTENYEGNL